MNFFEGVQKGEFNTRRKKCYVFHRNWGKRL